MMDIWHNACQKDSNEQSAVCGRKNRKRLKQMANISIYKKYIAMQIPQRNIPVHEFIQLDDSIQI